MGTKDRTKRREQWYESARTMTATRLPKFVRTLAEGDHDYEDAIHACAAAAVAAANLVAQGGGQLTDTQKQAVAEEFLKQFDRRDEWC